MGRGVGRTGRGGKGGEGGDNGIGPPIFPDVVAPMDSGASPDLIIIMYGDIGTAVS